MTLPRLYVITDINAAKRGCGDVLTACRAAADAGARMFQIRHKSATPHDQFIHAEEIATMLAGYGATVLINDRADIATALGCAGVHRPQSGLPIRALRRLIEYRLIGASCHSVRELLEADTARADFATLGPVFETPSKPGAAGMKTDGLSAASKLVAMPLYALGGVTPENARKCVQAGAHGVAVLSGIMAASDPYEATQAYLSALRGD